jgi:serine/threonine protein kinase
MAPETITGKYFAASDIWAVAASFIELVTGKSPWHEAGIEQSIALLFHIGSAKPPHHHPRIPRFLSDHGRHILARCFAFDPKDRPTAVMLLRDPYFRFDDFTGDDDDHRDVPPPPSGRATTPSEYRDDGALSDLDEAESLGESFASVESGNDDDYQHVN